MLALVVWFWNCFCIELSHWFRNRKGWKGQARFYSWILIGPYFPNYKNFNFNMSFTLLLQTAQHAHDDHRFMFRFYSITCAYTISWNNLKYILSSINFKFFFTQVTNTVLLHLTAGRQALWTLLSRCRTEFWLSLILIMWATLMLSSLGCKSRSASRRSYFWLVVVSIFSVAILNELDGELGRNEAEM